MNWSLVGWMGRDVSGGGGGGGGGEGVSGRGLEVGGREDIKAGMERERKGQLSH